MTEISENKDLLDYFPDLEKIWIFITGDQYKMNCGVCSGCTTMIHVIQDSDEFWNLRELLKNPDLLSAATVLIHKLNQLPRDKRYSNPQDEAYVFIMWAIAYERPEMFYEVFREIDNVNCFWLRMFYGRCVEVICNKMKVLLANG